MENNKLEGKKKDGNVLAMYDVRGIQEYIFRTQKVRDIIGASAIVEDIIMEALRYAVDELELKSEFEWETQIGPLPYESKMQSESKPGAQEDLSRQQSDDCDVQVLYIGGGNAYTICKTETCCKKINEKMAKFIMEKTYSLQLAVAMVEKKENFAEDYDKLFKEMAAVKTCMINSHPLGTLPIAEIDVNTGYALGTNQMSLEARLKEEKEEIIRKNIDSQLKRFESLIMKKGVDSNVAVVHIDGNNMGLRIRERIKGITDYTRAVNEMRRISWQINHCYKNVFIAMENLFNNAELHNDSGQPVQNVILKILTAGDDITYICNASVALASVEYFCREISQHTMLESPTVDNPVPDSHKKYGFSVCAGIAYMGYSFPYMVGYEVAEQCCDSAKKIAKRSENLHEGIIGNWVDFQICKNVQSKNLERMRQNEYVLPMGEELLGRPYEFEYNSDCNRDYDFNDFRKNMCYFMKQENFPRSQVKEIRNYYSLGQDRMEILKSFLQSRGRTMPDGSMTMWKKRGRVIIAKWYDAIEMMDYYTDLSEIDKEVSESGQ